MSLKTQGIIFGNIHIHILLFFVFCLFCCCCFWVFFFLFFGLQNISCPLLKLTEKLYFSESYSLNMAHNRDTIPFVNEVLKN